MVILNMHILILIFVLVIQLFYYDHDNIPRRYMKPDEVPDQNQIFMQLFLYSPVLLEVLLHDKTFSQVNNIEMRRRNILEFNLI